MIRKKIRAIAVLFFAGLTAFAWEANLENSFLQTGKFSGVVRGTDKKSILNFSTSPREDFPLVKTKIENGAFVLDTRAFFEKNNKGYVLIFWNGLKNSDFSIPNKGELYSRKRNVLRLIATPETSGLQCFGKRAKGDFYAKMNQVGKKQLDDEFFCITTSVSNLPSDARMISVRQVFSKPGIYKIKSAKVGMEEIKREKRVEKNWIHNGHAEQGLMYNPRVRFEYMENATSGIYEDWVGKQFVAPKHGLKLDSSEKHSGKYSFCLEWDGSKNNYSPSVSFAPVPVKPQETVAFSAWIKAEKPTSVSFSLAVSGGQKINKHFKVGTEWTRYEMFVPSYGEKTPGLHVGNAVTTVQGAEFNLSCPAIRLAEKGKVWIDDVAYYYGGHTKDPKLEDVYLSGSMDHENSYYWTGEPIKLKLNFNTLSKQEVAGTLSYQILDYAGEKIAEKELKRLSLAPMSERQEEISIVPPSDLRGAFNIVVSLRAKEKTYTAVFYAGVMEKNSRLSPRIGVELASCQNTKLILPFYKDFRIGFMRIHWTITSPLSRFAFEDAGDFADAGIKVILCIGGPSIVTNPEKFDPFFKEKVRKLKGRIEYYESINEANLFMTLEDNLQSIRRLHDLVKAIDPSAKLAGPASCGTDLPWTESILAKDGAKYLDAITEHPYRKSPEVPDYAREVKAWRKMIDRFKPGMPHIASEAGRCQESVLPGNLIDDFSREQTALDIRNILQSFAGGAERYMQFALSAWHPGIQYNVLFRGNGANNGTPVPSLTLYAIRAITDRLEQAKIDRSIDFGYDYRCHIFDHGTKRTAVMWKHSGLPGKLSFTKADAAKLTAYDFMGTKRKAETLILNAFPIYLDSTLSAAELEKLLLRGNLEDKNSKKAQISCSAADENSFSVKIQNRTNKTISCTITVLTPELVRTSDRKQTITISGSGEQSLPFHLVNRKISENKLKVRFSVQISGAETEIVEKELQAIFVAKAPEKIRIDGDLSDWKAIQPIRLDKKNLRWKAGSWGKAENSVHADVKFAWDYDNLYFSATVWKNKSYTAVGAKRQSTLYMYDSFQFGFDTMNNAREGEHKLGSDDFEYDFGLLDKKPLVYRRKSSSAVYDSLTKAVGPAKEVISAIRQYPDRIIYEAAFPRKAVSPFKLLPESTMKLGLLLNINNGKERAGYLELSDGLSSKIPALWVDFILKE